MKALPALLGEIALFIIIVLICLRLGGVDAGQPPPGVQTVTVYADADLSTYTDSIRMLVDSLQALRDVRPDTIRVTVRDTTYLLRPVGGWESKYSQAISTASVAGDTLLAEVEVVAVNEVLESETGQLFGQTTFSGHVSDVRVLSAPVVQRRRLGIMLGANCGVVASDQSGVTVGLTGIVRCGRYFGGLSIGVPQTVLLHAGIAFSL